MTTMNVSLPPVLKSFVDEQVAARGFGSSSDYVRSLIRADQDKQHLRALLLDGARSAETGEPDDAYFDSLRNRVAEAPRR